MAISQRMQKSNQNMIEVTLTHGNRLALRFPYSPLTVGLIKKLPGRKFHDDDPSDRHWTVPLYVLPQLLNGPLTQRLKLDYEVLAAYDDRQAPRIAQWRRLLATLEGKPSPVLQEVIERFGL